MNFGTFENLENQVELDRLENDIDSLSVADIDSIYAVYGLAGAVIIAVLTFAALFLGFNLPLFIVLVVGLNIAYFAIQYSEEKADDDMGRADDDSDSTWSY